MRRTPKTPRAKLIKELDIEWARIVKLNGECAICHKGDGILHAAHIFSRVGKSTRWDLDNGLPLCYYHHIRWAHQQPILFHDFVKEYLGEAKLELLRQRHSATKKWSIEDMQTLLATFKNIR